MNALRVFIGVDSRQPLAANVLQHSIYKRSSKPVAVLQLILSQLPIDKRGLSEFTYSRYLVPWLCDFQGWGLFLDSDMLVLSDIAELFELRDESKAVMVVKNKMRFEWPSLMLFNCAKCDMLLPEYVQKYASPQDFTWARGEVGDLPAEWNHCSNYDAMAPAKLVHYTQGVPCWFETSDSDYAKEWRDEREDMLRICAWRDIMATSVHARPVLERMMQAYARSMQMSQR